MNARQRFGRVLVLLAATVPMASLAVRAERPSSGSPSAAPVGAHRGGATGDRLALYPEPVPRAGEPVDASGAAEAAEQNRVKEPTAENIEVQKLAEGVYAAIRKEPPAVFVDANSVFIVTDAGVVVVDSNLTPGSARETLSALRKLTDRPVAYVINTHWHQDHVAGNQVYEEAFPDVEIIAHARMRAVLSEKGDATRRLYVEQGPKFATRLRSSVDEDRSFFGDALAPDERESYLAAASLIDRYVAEAPQMRTVLPTITFEQQMTLHLGGRTIELRSMGRGHTDNDVVVYLPAEAILVTGDLVVAPVPLTGDQSFIGDWANTLERLRALSPKVIVPGHGPVLHDDRYMRLLAELLAYIAAETAAAVSRGESLEEARARIDLSDYRRRFAGESKSLRLIFGDYVAGPAIVKAYAEASSAP